jgi:hypothetical protein
MDPEERTSAESLPLPGQDAQDFLRRLLTAAGAYERDRFIESGLQGALGLSLPEGMPGQAEVIKLAGDVARGAEWLQGAFLRSLMRPCGSWWASPRPGTLFPSPRTTGTT